MSSTVPLSLHPIMIIDDRYGGGYSRGRWIAVANADELIEGETRGNWCLHDGPSGGDMDACGFWSERPGWVAVGDTPDEALAKLIQSTHSSSTADPGQATPELPC